MTETFGVSSVAPARARRGCPNRWADSPHTEERLPARVLLLQQLVSLAPVTGFDVDDDAWPAQRRWHAGFASDVTIRVPEAEHARNELVLAADVRSSTSGRGADPDHTSGRISL
jgi:hypothetical protein